MTLSVKQKGRKANLTHHSDKVLNFNGIPKLFLIFIFLTISEFKWLCFFLSTNNLNRFCKQLAKVLTLCICYLLFIVHSKYIT